MKLSFRYIIIGLVLSLSLHLHATQRFFNLTYEQVRIDSVLPRFTYRLPLQGDYRDSVTPNLQPCHTVISFDINNFLRRLCLQCQSFSRRLS